MFYTFIQNNSGGYFIQNNDVDKYVIIEGDTTQELLDKSIDIFEDYSEFCPCCGERWDSYVNDKYLYFEPMIYGNSVFEYTRGFSSVSKAIIYYKDGTKKIVDTSRK